MPLRARPAAAAAAVAAALAATGCVSSRDIESLGGQVGDVQRQVLQLQKQAPSKEEVSSLQQQVAEQMASLLRSEADMQVKLDELSRQIDQLQANLEDTNYRLSQLSQQIAATNQELKTFRAPPPPPEPGAAEPGAGPAYTGDPRTLYQSAYNDYLRGSYDLAIREFREYLANFPDTDLADNAVYWIGESFYRQGRFREAAGQFDQVLESYPRSDKAASARLKKGYAQLELGETSQGVAQLQQVIRDHATSDEANLARQRLRELGREPR
jgi:tol-pal system protein YbgF